MVWVMCVASLGSVLLLMCGSSRAHASVEVLEAALAANVIEHEPHGKFSPQGHCREWGKARATRIDPTHHSSMVFWMRVKNATPLELVHTYYRASHLETQEAAWQELLSVTLPVGISSGWRTWSQKRLAWDTGQMLRGTLKVEVTTSAVPDTMLCTVYFFVLEDAVWQALTKEGYQQDTLCRIATTLSPSSLFRAGRQILESRASRDNDATTSAKLLEGWKQFTQHATVSHRLFCAGND